MLKRSLIFLVVIALLAVGGYYGLGRLRDTVKVDPPQLVTVKRGLFVHEVLERGSIDSAKNTDIANRVESSAAGANVVVVSVIPEGTIVEEGDLLIELEASTLKDSVDNQESSVLAAVALLAQAEASLKTSEIQLREYLEGVYNQERTAIQNRLFSAEEQVKTLENNLAHSKRLLERDYITQAQVDTELIELDKAINTREMEKLNLHVLETLTREKRITQLETAIETDKAQVLSSKRNLGFREERLKYLQDQLGRCKIYAPSAGQVVYFMPRWGGDDNLVREGMRVIERQVLLQLPDPTQMQVRGLINEANVRLVRPGQKATVRLEAFPNQVFDGVVRSVNDYPEPVTFTGVSMSREYLTRVTVLNPPEGIKVGLTAEARIVVNEIPGALILPMQAVFEYGGKMYAVTFKENKWDKIEIKTGPANDKEVVILEGLDEGDEVVLGAWAHRDKIELPRLEEEVRLEVDENDEELYREMMRREQESQQQRSGGQRGGVGSGGGPGGGGPGGGGPGGGGPGGGGPGGGGPGGGGPGGGGGGPRM